MDNLIALSDKCASAEEETNIDETKFVEFMRECPIWTYFKISHSAYVSKPHHEKAQMISEYYKAMSKGNTDIFFICYLFFLFASWIKTCLNYYYCFCLIRTFAE